MCGDNNADLLKIDLCNYNIFCSFIQNRKNEQISYFMIKKKKQELESTVFLQKSLRQNVILFGKLSYFIN